MSLDFYLEKTEEVFESNMTHNVTDMWRKAGCYDALYMSDGIEASNVIPFLEKAIERMKLEPDEYKKLNPKNGWGDYETALKFLKEVLEGCYANEHAIIRISK